MRVLKRVFSGGWEEGLQVSLEDNILKHRLTEDMKCSVTCLVLPEICRIPALKIAHELGHFAAKKTWQRMKNLFL